MMRIIFKKTVAVPILIFLCGCATRPYYVTPAQIKTMPGIYHAVKPGETLWRIAKTYDVSLDEVVKINRIPDAARINSGQLIFIPRAKEKQRILTYRQLKKEDSSFIWPLKGKIISHYGAQKGSIKNKGIDIYANRGAGVVASRSGKVSFCDDKVKGFGKTIILEHEDNFSTVYAHNSEILVKVNDWVNQKDVIARAGSTGRASSSRLHFEIRKKHQPQNPFHYLP